MWMSNWWEKKNKNIKRKFKFKFKFKDKSVYNMVCVSSSFKNEDLSSVLFHGFSLVLYISIYCLV